MNYHPDDAARVERLSAGGWDMVESGSMAELLAALAEGKLGRLGALSLRLEGSEQRWTGRPLKELVAAS